MVNDYYSLFSSFGTKNQSFGYIIKNVYNKKVKIYFKYFFQ